MIPSRTRLLFGAASAASFLAISYALFAWALRIDPRSPGYDITVASLVSGLTVPVLAGWLAYDLAGGALAAGASIFVSWVFDLKTGYYASPAFILQFICAFVAGYGFFSLRTAADRAAALSLEKLGEEVNTLTNAIADRRRAIFARVEKFARYSTLKGVVESLSTVLSAEEIHGLIIDKALQTLARKSRALLYLVDVDAQELMLSASRNETRVKAKKGDVFDRWVLRHRRSLIVEDASRDFRFPARDTGDAQDTLASLIASPLTSDDKVVGIIRLDSQESGAYTQDDLRLLEIVANLGAVALQNAYLYSRTQELAIRDGLTGLFVRRHFIDRFTTELLRTAEKRGELAVLVLDIDHFKAYNDRFGHTAGDLVLKHLARIAGSMVREGDIVARYGGEEFVVVLAGRGKAAAVAEAEAIRQAIAAKPFTLRRHLTNITASIGVACYPADGVTQEALLVRADDRMYRAKREGRNRVCSA